LTDGGGPQGKRQLPTGAVAVLGLLCHRLGHDSVNLGRKIRSLGGDWRRLVMHVCPEQRNGPLTVERNHARQALVEHTAERIQICPAIHRPALDLLRSDVIKGADELTGGSEVGVRGEVLGDAEVTEIVVLLTLATIDQDVGRFDIAVNQPLRVGGVKSSSNLSDDGGRSLQAQRAGLEQPP
jgi:hypothetical protein